MSQFDSYSVSSPTDGIFPHKFSSEIGGNILFHKFKGVLRLVDEFEFSVIDHCLALTATGLCVGEAYYSSPVHDFGGGAGMSKVEWISVEQGGSKIDNDIAGFITSKVIEVRSSNTAPVLNISGGPWVNDQPPSISDTVWGTGGSLAYVFVINQGLSGFNISTGAPVPLPQGRYVQFRVRFVGPAAPLQHKFGVP